jgi:hypothetical protein
MAMVMAAPAIVCSMRFEFIIIGAVPPKEKVYVTRR